MSQKTGIVIEFIFRAVLGGAFIWAGVAKASDPISFLDAIRGYRIIGDPWAAWVAMGLPWIEIVVGVCLILRRPCYRGAVAVLGGMLAVFSVALVSAWARGLDIDCGCFGVSDSTGKLWIAVVRDGVMLAMAAWLGWRVWKAGERPPKEVTAEGM